MSGFRAAVMCRHSRVRERDSDDAGQFMKVALMRWLVSPSPYGRGHRLGVVWFQEPDAHHAIDSDHVDYLNPSDDSGDELRSLDPALYDRLRLIAARSGRPLSVREACCELPKDSVRFDRPLTFDALLRDDPAARVVSRQRWFHEAMVALSACSLVFLDSDVGDDVDDSQPASGDSADEGVWMSEVGQLLDRGQSVVTHQLIEPSRARPDSIRTHLNDVHGAVGVEPLVLVRESGDRTRFFTVIPHGHHRSDMQDRIGALQLTRWGDEFRVHRRHPTLVSA